MKKDRSKKKQTRLRAWYLDALRFGLLLGAFLILTGLTFWDNGLKNIYIEFGGARVCFYVTRDETLDLKNFSDDIVVTVSGTGLIIDAPGEKAAGLRRGFSKTLGESVAFTGGIADAEEIIAFYRAETAYTETIPLLSPDGKSENRITVIYARSALLTKYVKIEGRKINLQIAVNSATGRVTAGTPLILGSY